MTHGHRAREKGVLINLPYGLNQAGMAPRVGKSGKSIRLYVQRVDHCDCICEYDPVTITRRVFITGDIGDAILDNALNGPGWFASSNIGGLVPVPASGIPAQNQLNSRHQPYYGIVFSKEIKVLELLDPGTTDSLEMYYTEIGTPGSVTSGQLCFSIPSTDFKIINLSGKLGSWDKRITIGLGKAPSTTLPDGASATGTRVWNMQAPIVPHGPWNNGFNPNRWCPVNELANSLNPNNPDNTQANLSSQSATGMASNDVRKDYNYAYYITNPAIFGGYTLLFNVANPILSSYFGSDDPASFNFTATAPTGNPPKINKSSSSTPSGTIIFRGDLAALTYINNNIITRYVPTNADQNSSSSTVPFPQNFRLIDETPCPNFNFAISKPVAPFTIPRNGAPGMEIVTTVWSP